MAEEAEVGIGERRHDAGSGLRRLMRFEARVNRHDHLPLGINSALPAHGEPTGSQYLGTGMKGETPERTVAVW
jgi:hypothetical protein